MIHIWHEDSSNSATNIFWNFLKKYMVSEILNNADIRGFNSNSKLSNHIEQAKFNAQDKYYIFVDYVPDNQKALKYYDKIKDVTKNMKNVRVANLLCFEYLILKFRYFLNWTKPIKNYKEYNDGITAREELIKVVESQGVWITNHILVNYVVKRKGINTSLQGWQRELSFISLENVATLILSKMTNGGTIDFGVSKTRLGICWYCDCCSKYNNNKTGNNKCRMYKYRKKAIDKARILWNHTDANKIIR